MLLAEMAEAAASGESGVLLLAMVGERHGPPPPSELVAAPPLPLSDVTEDGVELFKHEASVFGLFGVTDCEIMFGTNTGLADDA